MHTGPTLPDFGDQTDVDYMEALFPSFSGDDAETSFIRPLHPTATAAAAVEEGEEEVESRGSRTTTAKEEGKGK
jgi:hypothetical protein